MKRILEYPFVVLFLVLALSFVWAGQLRSEEAESEARTKASLALAKAARERTKIAPAYTAKETDQDRLEAAYKEARKRGLPIVCWVAMHADDSPELKRSFGEVIHVEVTSNDGNRKPRVLFVRPDKMEAVAYCSEAGLRSDTAKKMWAVYREVMGLPVSKSPAPQQVGYARPVVMPFVGGGVGDNCST